MDKIVCVGKNYSEHIKEMAAMLGDAVPQKPVIFLKPPCVLKAAISNGDCVSLRIPRDVKLIHHECEIVLRVGADGFQVSEGEATHMIEAVTLGLDMTRRDLQAEQKKAGHPWTTSKVFIDSAVIGPWRSVGDFPDYLSEPFRFYLNGELKQEGHGKDMLTHPAACISYISQWFPLCKGDLIYTGSPAGVGAVTVGQRARLEWGSIKYSAEWMGMP